MKLQSACACLTLLLFTSPMWPQQPQGNYDESKVGSYVLPDPLLLQNGRRVTTAKEWVQQRRPEIWRLFAESWYGFPPKPAGPVRYEVTEQASPALERTAVRRQVTVYFSPDHDAPREHLLIYLPVHRAAHSAAILSLNFLGNQSVIDDPGVALGTVWDWKTHEPHIATNDSRGKDKEFAIRQILQHGYAFVTIYYGDIEPDFAGGLSHGIRPLFFKPGQTEPGPQDWGAIGAWGYGLSRAMDYLERDPEFDAKRIAVMGHSRLGKAVLWAGATDQRFALIIASCSGEGGASLARRNYGETLHNLATAFPYWFCRNFVQFADDPNRSPVDTHELIALLAPRPVYITGAEDDKWSDPRGEFLAAVAAGPVYRLLGKQDLGTSEMPPVNTPIQHTIAFHYRTGKHDVTAYDWDQFLAYADEHLRTR